MPSSLHGQRHCSVSYALIRDMLPLISAQQTCSILPASSYDVCPDHPAACPRSLFHTDSTAIASIRTPLRSRCLQPSCTTAARPTKASASSSKNSNKNSPKSTTRPAPLWEKRSHRQDQAPQPLQPPQPTIPATRHPHRRMDTTHPLLTPRMRKPDQHTLKDETVWILILAIVLPFLAIVAVMLLCIKFCKRKPPGWGLGGDLWRK